MGLAYKCDAIDCKALQETATYFTLHISATPETPDGEGGKTFILDWRGHLCDEHRDEVKGHLGVVREVLIPAGSDEVGDDFWAMWVELGKVFKRKP